MDEKLYNKVMSGKSDHNIRFKDFEKLIVQLGFCLLNQTGSHSTYAIPGVYAHITINPDGNKAHGYQVKKLRNFIRKNGLGK